MVPQVITSNNEISSTTITQDIAYLLNPVATKFGPAFTTYFKGRYTKTFFAVWRDLTSYY